MDRLSGISNPSHDLKKGHRFGTPKVFRGVNTSTPCDHPFKWMVRSSRGANTFKHLWGTELEL